MQNANLPNVDLLRADLLLTNITQIATCSGSEIAKRGDSLREVDLLTNTNIAIKDGKIQEIGDCKEIQATETIDCHNCAVVPGFIDPHTHTVFGGDRVHEFEMRIAGATYMEIMAEGGGIVSTMRHTRQANEDHLFETASQRLDQMLALGTTTVEIKTGYGLDTETELKMLRIIDRLGRDHPCTIVPTFLGAHTLPPKYKDNPTGYVDLVINDMLPAVADWYKSSSFYGETDCGNVGCFVDVFLEDHAFDIAQTRMIFETAQTLGFKLKIHVDQFNAMGGTEMAVEMGAISADHLDVTTESGIKALANSDTIAIPLPAANFNLGHTKFAPARELIDAGAAVALATDLNPGSAPCYSMPLVMAIANRYLRMTPAETLNAATINAAHAIGLGKTHGSIEVGKQADLLVLRNADYRHISYFLGGNPIKTIICKGDPWVAPTWKTS